MTETKWTLHGREFANCNCSYGCPCQFNALPTHGNCWAVVGIKIDKGHHGTVTLDGLRIAGIFKYPGAIHMGNGEALPIVDKRATEEQRNALLRIMSGLDTVPGATFFQVFSTTFEQVEDPVFAPIELAVDIEGRRARLRVEGWIDAHGEPITNPVTGEEHRARINLPHGFEYETCEVGRGWATTQGPVDVQLSDSHAQFATLHMTESGVVH